MNLSQLMSIDCSDLKYRYNYIKYACFKSVLNVEINMVWHIITQASTVWKVGINIVYQQNIILVWSETD